jgi:hypothetical protein
MFGVILGRFYLRSWAMSEWSPSSVEGQYIMAQESGSRTVILGIQPLGKSEWELSNPKGAVQISQVPNRIRG